MASNLESDDGFDFAGEVRENLSLAQVNEELRARNEQLAAVAALGQQAIGGRDLTALLDQAAARVADTLGARYTAIGQATPDCAFFITRAGRGWRPGTIGAIQSAVGTPAAFLLASGRPLIIADIRAESRFPIPQTMRDHGVVSAVYVIIRGRDRPWGTLGAYMTHARAFSTDDIDFLQSVANVVALAVERHEVEIDQRREKEILQAIFDNIPVMISFYGPNGRLLSVNRAWEETLGWRLEEAQSEDILARAYPDPESRRAAAEFIARSERRWGPFKTRTRDGRELDTLWARFALSDGSRVGFGLDVTERARAEAALAESEARFARLFEASPVALGMARLDDGRITAVNESWLRFYGFTREEVIGKTNEELNLAVDPVLRRGLFERLKAEGGLRDAEARVRLKSGEVRDVIASVTAFQEPGNGAYLLAAQTDITELKRVHAERDRLLESERLAREGAERALERLNAIQNITEGVLIHHDVDGILAVLLARLRQTLRLQSSTVMLVDMRTQELYARQWDGNYIPDMASVRVPVGKGLSGRIVAEGRALIVNDGSELDLSGVTGTSHAASTAGQALIGAPLEVAGKIIGAVVAAAPKPRRFTEDDLGFMRLVADRVSPAIERARLEKEGQEAQERLGALSRRLLTAQEEERRRLAVELHDELGQVLTAIKINLESLALSDAAATAVRVGDAIRSVDHAMQRVRDLALDLRPSVLDDLGLPSALRWYVDRFAKAASTEARVSIDAMPDLDPQVETACFRVAQEALTNVARHAQARRVWLNLSLVPAGLELRVRDDGIGFDAVEARLRATHGASMGLLGMEERVSLTGGEFDVTPASPHGSEVRALFPVKPKGPSLT